jgi:hypothetical protein
VNTVEARTAPPSRPKTERLKRLQDAGVSIWLDTLSRELLETGEFAHLVREFSVTGATSNPTIFAKAITSSDRYDGQLRSLSARGIRDPQALFFAPTGSSPSSAPQISPTTALGRSSRRFSCAAGSTGRT